jgi:hypothetical protein
MMTWRPFQEPFARLAPQRDADEAQPSPAPSKLLSNTQVNTPYSCSVFELLNQRRNR